MLRTLGFFLLLIVIAAAGAAAYFLGPYFFNVSRYHATPKAGFHADFYLYVSPKARDRASQGLVVTLLVQPNNSGVNSDDPEVHLRDAWWMGFERQSVADELGVVLLVPAFVRPGGDDAHIYTHALDRDTFAATRDELRRPDLQLIAMIAVARVGLKQDGITLDEKFLIQGYSASGMFANRFTILHPRLVKAAAIGSPGGWPVAPVATAQGATLNYPAGVADVEVLTGEAFNAEAYSAVPQVIIMGDQDTNDSLDFRDGWDEADAAMIERLFGDTPVKRWNGAKTLYAEANADVRFELVKGVSHERKALQPNATRFLRDVLRNEAPKKAE